MSAATVTVNGEQRPFAGQTLLQTVQALGYDAATAGIAIALNETIVPRSRWSETTLDAGDRVELVGAVQGG